MVLLQLRKLNKLDSSQTNNAMKWNNVKIRLKFKIKYELKGESQNFLIFWASIWFCINFDDF